MTSAILPFGDEYSHPFKGTRVYIYADRRYYRAADICRRLGISRSRALAGFSEDETRYAEVRTPRGWRDVLVLTEPGLYRLFLETRSPVARPFQEAVFGSLLPAIWRNELTLGAGDEVAQHRVKRWSRQLKQHTREATGWAVPLDD